MRASSALHRQSTSGRGGLHERELEARARVGAGAHRLHRRAEQLEQAHDDGAGHALGLRAQRRVGLGRERQLGRHLAERLHDEQLARAHLEVAGERRRVAALLGALARAAPAARARVAGGDRVDGLCEQPRVGHAEHREHVLQRDLRCRCR